MTAWLVIAALALAVAAFGFLQRSRVGRLPGRLVYDDTVERVEAVLVSRRHGLKGKPDHVIRTRDGLVPVERKAKDWRGSRPRDGDRAQLLAYCLLIEEAIGERVRHGLLRYEVREFVVPFGAGERQEIVDLLEAMRAASRAPDVARSHSQATRCRACGYRVGCAEALG